MEGSDIMPRYNATSPHPNVYRLPKQKLWYVNWQLMGQVYRRAFTDREYGSEKKALAAAEREVRWLEANREKIAKQLTRELDRSAEVA